MPTLTFIFSQFLHIKQITRPFSSSKVCSLISTSLSSSELQVDVLEGTDSGIVVLGLNRPSARNALGKSMSDALLKAVEKIHLDDNARVVILRSLVSGVFCAGADLKERIELSNSDVSRTVAKLSAISTGIENIPIPTLAAIDGVAFGGGLEITLGCDLRIVSETAKLGLVETKWAILPGAGGTQRLPRLVNSAVAKELIFCARVIDGNKAKEIGLVNHVVKQNSSSNAAYEKAVAIAREILKNGPVGVRMAKVSINEGLRTDLQSGCKIEQLCYAQVIPTEDRKEGLKAFIENRLPKYKGK